MAEAYPATGPPSGHSGTQKHHDQPATSPGSLVQDQCFLADHVDYTWDDFAISFVDSDHQQDELNDESVCPPSPPISPPPMRVPKPSTFDATAQATPRLNSVTSEGIDEDMGCSSSPLDMETWALSLDLTDDWQQLLPAVGHQLAAPDLDPYMQDCDLLVAIAPESQSNAITAEPAPDHRSPTSATEAPGTVSWDSGVTIESKASEGRKRSTRSTRSSQGAGVQRRSAARSISSVLSQPGQSVFALQSIGDDNSSAQTDTLQPSIIPGSHTFPFGFDPRTSSLLQQAAASQNDPSSPDQQMPRLYDAVSPPSDLGRIHDLPFSSIMSPSSIDRLGLYEARARNRMAATRCRVKRRASLAKLKEEEQIVMHAREQLLGLKKLLTEQVCALKEELFVHARCKGEGSGLIAEYLQLTAERVVDKAREAAAQQGSTLHADPFGNDLSEHPGDDAPVEGPVTANSPLLCPTLPDAELSASG